MCPYVPTASGVTAFVSCHSCFSDFFFFSGAKTDEGGASEPTVGNGALKSGEFRRTGQGKLPLLGSVGIEEYGDILRGLVET